MSKPTTQIEMFGAIQINGKIVHRFADKVSVQKIIVDSARWLASEMNDSRDISTLEIIMSKRLIEEVHRTTHDGIDMSNVPTIDEVDEETRKLIEEYERRQADPIYQLFATTHQRRAVETHGPEGWARIRKHVETTYGLDLSHYE